MFPKWYKSLSSPLKSRAKLFEKIQDYILSPQGVFITSGLSILSMIPFDLPAKFLKQHTRTLQSRDLIFMGWFASKMSWIYPNGSVFLLLYRFLRFLHDDRYTLEFLFPFFTLLTLKWWELVILWPVSCMFRWEYVYLSCSEWHKGSNWIYWNTTGTATRGK